MTLPPPLLEISPVIPVVVVDGPDQAVPLARALLAGGIRVLEITLRTAGALDAIRAVASDVPDVVVGAGSVLRPGQVEQSLDAGARFLVSPGTSPTLLRHLLASGVEVLPGVATVGEVLTALDLGARDLKFFPAGPAGGPAYLQGIAGPVPTARFCPTGGVTLENLPTYLACPNVPAVGGSWLAPASLVAEGRWDAVTERAALAIATATSCRERAEGVAAPPVAPPGGVDGGPVLSGTLL